MLPRGKVHFSNGEFRYAVKALDMGIIMGGLLFRKDLDSIIEVVLVAKARQYQNMGANIDKEGCEKKDLDGWFVQKILISSR